MKEIWLGTLLGLVFVYGVFDGAGSRPGNLRGSLTVCVAVGGVAVLAWVSALLKVPSHPAIGPLVWYATSIASAVWLGSKDRRFAAPILMGVVGLVMGGLLSDGRWPWLVLLLFGVSVLIASAMAFALADGMRKLDALTEEEGSGRRQW